MSKFNPHHENAALYEAAQKWAERCLIGTASILSDDQSLWSLSHFDELDRRFVQNFDEGSGTFLEKLKGQLSGGSPQCHQLMAELMWALNLFPSNIGSDSKRRTVTEIWSWSGVTLQPDHPYLSDAVLVGIGSAGTAFNTHRWREVSFAINILRELRSRDVSDQRQILTDPWRFIEWLQMQPGAGQRQLLHILPHLIFPETFERISSAGDKLKILLAFTDEPKSVWRNRSAVKVDRALLQLREKLEADSGVQIDFYSDELRPRWKEAPTLSTDAALSDNTFALSLEAFLSAYGDARAGAFTTSGPVAQAMVQLRHWLQSCPPVAARPSIKVKLSVGQGGWTKTPWIALLDDRVTTSTQRGIYIVFLVAEDLTRTYLTLNQGMTDLVARLGQRGAVEEMLRVSETSRPRIEDIVAEKFKLDNEISLASDTTAARNYEAGTIANLELTRGEFPDDDLITEHLATLLNAYDRLIEAPELEPGNDAAPVFGLDQAIEDLFLERSELENMLEIWRAKKNLILQGAPGVGKSFIARRLAHCLMRSKDNTRVRIVQFHQSYSYEDFIRGYRPSDGTGFALQDGIFFEFCQRAAQDPDRPYVLVIDEINRGNLSKILGELMLLIEHDKRGPEWSMRLAYMHEGEPDFFVPKNLYLLGMMNTADRSLSLVDYALRRRFSFVSMEPKFAAPKFRAHISAKGVPDVLADRIVQRMEELNQEIGSDRVNLGPGFRIGHSFFCPAETPVDPESWYERVVRTEIFPLLEEYWFDDPVKADQWRERLLS